MKRVNLNFFCAGTCPKIINDQLMINVVQYFDSSEHKQTHEVRLPGGTVQHSDIIVGFKKVQHRVGLSDSTVENFEEFVKDVVVSFYAEVFELPNKTNIERIAIRIIFVKSLKQIEDYLNNLPRLTDRHRIIIEDAIKEETLRRELRYECGITNYELAYENGYVKRGEHFQYSYIVINSDGPDEYTGSPDHDIERSYYEPLSKLNNGYMYPPHRTLMVNALNAYLLMFENDQEMSVSMDQVKEYLKPAN